MGDKINARVAIVTGGSGGIGSAIASELAQNDYYLIINYKSNEMAALQTVSLIREKGGDGEALQFDITSLTETKDAVDDVASRFKSIDVLVNNAGVTADGLLLMMSEKNWDTVVNTSLKGFFNITKPVLNCMVRKKRGSVVSIASVSGLRGNRGQANYSAAKAGLIGASRSVAAEVARLGIRVNVVAPGLIATPMIEKAPIDKIKELIPMARIGKPEEVAKVVRFLCSDDASYITGQVISVNGGMF